MDSIQKLELYFVRNQLGSKFIGALLNMVRHTYFYGLLAPRLSTPVCFKVAVYKYRILSLYMHYYAQVTLAVFVFGRIPTKTTQSHIVPCPR